MLHKGQENMFDRLVWKADDCMLLDDLVFRVMHHKTGDWSGGEHFIFYKIQELVDQYHHYFQRRSDFRPRNVLELGIFDGGSIAFWHELFKPEKHVAVDLMDQKDNPYLKKYMVSRGLSEKIKTCWNTDQADKPKLMDLVKTEFNGSLEFVVDDASHLYEPSLASFEVLFPLMVPGGLYIIEDWAWGHWRDFVAPAEWAGRAPLTKLVFELIEATGSWNHIISNITVYQGFISIERGPRIIEDPLSFSLENTIYRRSTQKSFMNRFHTFRRFLSYLKRG